MGPGKRQKISLWVVDTLRGFAYNIGMTQEIILDWWWNDEDLYVVTKSGEYKLEKPYISNIHYHGLETTTDDSMIMIGNNKAWNKE